MKWFFGLFVAAAMVILVIIVRLPASLVPLVLSEAEQRHLLSPGAPRLYLQQTSGTVWKGRAEDAVLEVDGVSLPLGVLNWTLSPTSVLQLRPELLLASSAPKQTLRATVSVDRQQQVTVADMEGRLPISVLEPWFPMLINGDIAFVIDHMVFHADRLLAVDGILNLEYVDWIGGDYDMPLGSYMAHLYREQNQVRVQFDDLGAALGVDGLMTIQPDGAYAFNAVLQPRNGLAPEVNESLNWFGKRQANGSVVILKRGHL